MKTRSHRLYSIAIIVCAAFMEAFQNMIFFADYAESSLVHNPSGPAVFVEPPDPAQDTDEFSGHEDLGEIDADHIQKRQLLAPEHLEGQESETTTKKKKEPWKNQGLDDVVIIRSYSTTTCDQMKERPNTRLSGLFPSEDCTSYRDFQPHELFELAFDEALSDHFIHLTFSMPITKEKNASK